MTDTFQTLWETCKKQAPENNLDETLDTYSQRIFQMRSELISFQEFLRTIPVSIAIGHWLKGLSTDGFWQQRNFPKIKQLIQQKLIPFLDQNGESVTLEYFMQCGHQALLESIRCVKEWSLLEKEDIIQCYVHFTHNLADETQHLIAPGYDPDRERVRNKAIPYETFLDFVQHLSERDALIAKLIYFGAPSIEEVLSLTCNQVDPAHCQLHFSKQLVQYPKHIIHDLNTYIYDKQSPDLVFTNVRQEQVDRAHLNHTFARASDKISNNSKITPGGLLKLKR